MTRHGEKCYLCTARPPGESRAGEVQILNPLFFMLRHTLILSAFLAFCSLTTATAQEGAPADFEPQRHEAKINLAGIFSPAIEIQYDYLFRPDLTFGAAVSAGLDHERYPYYFQVTPAVRWFFGGNHLSAQRYAAGFFIELNGSVFTGPATSSLDGGASVTETAVGGGLGFATGWKYVSSGHWVGEIFGGLGKNFNGNMYQSLYPRAGVTIGYRF